MCRTFKQTFLQCVCVCMCVYVYVSVYVCLCVFVCVWTNSLGASYIRYIFMDKNVNLQQVIEMAQFA